MSKFKKYKLRPKIEETFELCQCGHYRNEHEITFWSWGLGKCKICECPKFNKHGTYTYDEICKIQNEMK